MRQPLGVTFVVPEGKEATGVYDDPSGIKVFTTDEPYALLDGASLEPPLPIKIVDGPVFIDSMGNAQTALGVSGLGPAPEPIIGWNDDSFWNDDEAWDDDGTN